MEFYFTDRSFHLLGIATAGSDHTNDFRISGEIERTNVDAAMVAFNGTLYFPKKQLSKAEAMCQDLNYMLYMDDDGNGRMITITASHADGTGYCIAFEGTDAGNDLKNEIVDAYTATKQMTFEQYFNIFTGNSGWEIGVNEIPTDVRTLTFDSEDTSYDRMKSVATQFGVETYFSFSIVGTTMVKCYLNVVKKRGADRGITLRVGDEINRITVDSDSTNLMTAVYARGATPDGSDTPINLVGYSYTDPTGQFVLTKEGYLLDTVSNRIYSRLRQNSTATVDGGYLNHVIDYEATTQASLLQSALADLKQNNHPAVNYTIELAKIPQNIRCGDTVQIEQEDRQLYLSARVLELDKCYSNPSSSTMVMGDYLLETSQVAKQYQDLAQKLKDIPKTIQYYPWLRYADDDKGTNMSALPAGKKYMAVVYSNKSSVPSDDPADYAGRWALIKGADGADGVPGAKGADGRTSYFHTAWADDVSGQSGFTVSGGDGKKYIGTYSDFTQADSTNPSDYNWALFKGADGKDGYTPIKGTDYFDGKDGQDGKSSYLWIRYSKNADGTEMTSDPTGAKYVGYATTQTTLAPTSTSAYKWQLVAGKDGIAGEKGADGKTSYLHIRYSNDGGQTFTTNSGETVGAYIGQYTDFTQSDSNSVSAYKWALIKGDKGDTGKDGVAGKDGIGIKSTTITYALGDSGTAPPTTGWTTSVPSLIKGKYLWTKTVWLYTDNTSESGYSTTYIGKDGNNGNDGLAGKDGVGISATKVEYVGSTSGTNKPTSGWLTTVPSVAAGSFLWTKTTWSYTDGTSESGYSVAKMGEKGDQGIKGPSGADGKTPYFHIAYADSSDGRTNFSLDTPGSRKYIGSYTDFTQADSTNPADYSWQLVQGPKGDTGVGIPGPKGADGKTSYFHTAYANSIDGKQGFSTTDGNGKSYFGQYVDYTQADSTDPTKYSWALFKGTDGRDGKDGSDNVPVITVGAAYPSSPKKGDMHWLTDSSGVVTGYYTYDGTKWNPYKIDAKILSAETFNGLTFNGVTFNGSRFITPFNGHPKITGGEEDPFQWTRGIISVGDGEVKMTTTSSKTQNGEATATGLVEMTTGLIYSSQQIANSKEKFEATLSPGQLFLSHTANNGGVVSGYIDTELVNELNARGRVIWQGGFYPASNDTIIPSMKLSQTLTGWLVMWSRYENGVIRNNDYAYSIIPRGLVVYQSLGSNYFRVTATMAGHGTFSKTFWLADDRIIGDDGNKQDNAAFAVINNIFAI
jgi:phage minor structural protein|nr:MAG TPA: tail protein [Caudoviricetes sp.]